MCKQWIFAVQTHSVFIGRTLFIDDMESNITTQDGSTVIYMEYVRNFDFEIMWKCCVCQKLKCFWAHKHIFGPIGLHSKMKISYRFRIYKCWSIFCDTFWFKSIEKKRSPSWNIKCLQKKNQLEQNPKMQFCFGFIHYRFWRIFCDTFWLKLMSYVMEKYWNLFVFKHFVFHQQYDPNGVIL